MKDLERDERIALFDVYGELLSAKQQEYFRMYYFEDLSFGEIAENNAVSRQAVQIALEQAVEKMQRFEHTLHVIEGRHKREEIVRKIADYIGDARLEEAQALLQTIKE